MTDILRWIAARLANGSSLALAAVTRAAGSTARSTDAFMALDAAGGMMGTVGGGYAEAKTIEACRTSLATSASTDLEFDLTPEAHGTQMVCGGRLSIHIEYVEEGSAPANALAECLQHVERGEAAGWSLWHPLREEGSQTGSVPFAIVTRADTLTVYGNAPDSIVQDAVKALHDTPPGYGMAAMLNARACRGFWLGFEPAPLLYVFGAGHVGKAVCELAAFCGFRVMVTDDRPDQLTRERFPHASSLRLITSFDNALSAGPSGQPVRLSARDCALILTRKPDIDKAMLAQLLRSEAGYIGLIGSVSKRNGIYAALRAEGFSDADFARVHCPVGLAIGARSPEEIAVSIMAEIIAHRSGALLQQ